MKVRSVLSASARWGNSICCHIRLAVPWQGVLRQQVPVHQWRGKASQHRRDGSTPGHLSQASADVCSVRGKGGECMQWMLPFCNTVVFFFFFNAGGTRGDAGSRIARRSGSRAGEPECCGPSVCASWMYHKQLLSRKVCTQADEIKKLKQEGKETTHQAEHARPTCKPARNICWSWVAHSSEPRIRGAPTTRSSAPRCAATSKSSRSNASKSSRV